MEFKKENFTDSFDESIPLLFEHWEEIAHYPDIKLDPDVKKYTALQESGSLRVFTARVEGKLVGYSVYIVGHNIHYRESLQAKQDVIFIHKDHRGLGFKFIKFCDDQLREEGVQAVYHHVKAQHNWGRMLLRQGYELVDLIYAKRLDL